MTRSKEIQDELQLISSALAEYQAVNPYSVPAGYFENLPSLILQRLNSSIDEPASTELSRISPLLASASKKMPYSVPENYFDDLIKKSASPLEEESTARYNKPARIISLQPRKIFRYAAAAIAVGLVSLVAWFYSSRQTETPDQITQRSDTPAETLLQQRMEKVSEEEMATFVESSNAYYLLENAMPTGELAGGDALFMFDEISDQELEQYLRTYQPSKEKFN